MTAHALIQTVLDEDGQSQRQLHIKSEELTSVAETLDALVKNKEARLYISGQHALDESLIFGTSDAYLRLASELVKFIVAAERGETRKTESVGIPIQTSGSISDTFDSCSEVILDNSDLVETEEQARKLFEYFWEQQAQTTFTCHMADYSKQEFQDCNFTDVELINCKTAGLKINGVELQNLLACYKANFPESPEN